MMTKLSYTQANRPTPEEARRQLAEALAVANPVDDLLALSTRLHAYEAQYGLSSDEFFRQFQQGVLDDELQHCAAWASAYDLFVKTKRLLEATLMRTAILEEPLEVMA
jgi:hypothetical protein